MAVASEKTAVIVTCSTPIIYNIIRRFKVKTQAHRTSHWYQKNKRWVYILNIFLGVGVLIFTAQKISLDKGFKIITVLLPLLFLTHWYIVPLRPFKKLRDLPYVKIFIIGIVWVGCCVFLPLFLAEKMNPKTALFLLAQWFFIIALTLPFDIRDIYFDKANALKTIPIKLGIKKTKILVVFLLVCVLALHYASNIQLFIKTLVLIAILIIFIGSYSPAKKEYYITFWLESFPFFWWCLLYF